MNKDEVLFRRIPCLLPTIRTPRLFESLLKTKRTPAGDLWMRRNEVDEESLRKGGWNILLSMTAVFILIIVTLLLIFGAGVVAYCLVPSAVAPLIVASLYMSTPEQRAQAEERQMLREAPSVMGSIAMSMQVAPSLEGAVAFASERGEGVLARRLREARWSNMTRCKGSLNEALEDLASSLSGSTYCLKQAIHLIISSTSERTKEGMDRLLDKANMVVLNGVRDAVESYVASLSLPTMVLFSLGTLLPIMLFSILPLLSVGTSLSGAMGSALPLPYLALLLLAVIPTAALCYSWKILSRNPLGMMSSYDKLATVIKPSFALAWVLIFLSAFLVARGDLAPYIVSGAAVLPPCAYLGWKLRRQGSEERKRRELERDGSAALFQIGNRMLSGATMEKALGEVAAEQGNELSALTRELLYRSRLSGERLDDLITKNGKLNAISPDLENAYITVARCAEQDPINAGKVALNLAQMLSDLHSCQRKVEERLRGVIDMMRSTSTVFAPIVLGMTGALFSLISTRAPDAAMIGNDIVLITGVYIGELSFLVSFFTVLLRGERSWKGVAYSYAVRTPLAFGVFAIVSVISRTGLTGLL